MSSYSPARYPPGCLFGEEPGRVAREQPKQAFSFEALGKLASLGHRSAVAEVFGIKLSGFIAWVLWRAIYLMKLPGLDRKLRVSTEWFLDLLLPPDIVQLKLDKATSVLREHFEPHEIIFRQGDLGDRLYVIVEGEVELFQEGSGQAPRLLARLGAGECFGEMALVNDKPRVATARSVTRANLLSVARHAFGERFAHHPPLRRMFEALIDERRRAAMPSEPEGQLDLTIVTRQQAR